MPLDERPCTVALLPNLKQFSDEQLDRVTQASPLFLDRRWFRLVDAVDVSALANGPLEVRYAVVTRGDDPLAICPVLISRRSEVYRFYSFERTFFTKPYVDLAKLSPKAAPYAPWLARAASLYRRAANSVGDLGEGWVLAISPLSQRGGVAVDPAQAPGPLQQKILERLQALAEEEHLPLCFAGVSDDEPALRARLCENGFEEVFLHYDNVLQVPGSFDDYLEHFKSDARYHVRKELRRSAAAGVRFELAASPGALGAELCELYRATQSRYGDDYLGMPRPLWAEMERHLGSACQVVLGRREGRLLGFNLLLHKGDLWAFRVGRSYEQHSGEEDAFYFNLMFYETVRRAVSLKASRAWLGPSAWETKRRRGSLAASLFRYFWFPEKKARMLFTPYLRFYSHVARKTLDFAARPSSWLKATKPQAQPVS